MIRFQELAKAEWRQVLHDRCTGNWQDAWFLDGRKATLINGPDGMTFTAGPTAGDDACHAVLWTKDSVQGDGREQLCHFRNVALPPIVAGRIGLRHMYTRGARCRDFRVSVPAKP